MKTFPNASSRVDTLLMKQTILCFFYRDLWRMDIDVITLTVNWTQIFNASELPLVAQGGFHQFWKKNVTAFSWTAGLNVFDPAAFTASCIGSEIITYDYSTNRFETIVPNGADAWRNMSSAGCGKFGDDVYCYGGFNCTDFSEPKLFTKYHIPTNTLQQLSPTGIDTILARTENSVTCITTQKKCLIGSGQLIEGGTVDQWNYYDITTNSFEFPVFANQPTRIEYLSPDITEIWNITGGNYTVLDNEEMLVTGGDNTSFRLLSSNTLRYLAKINYHSNTFKQIPTCFLFTIKGEYLRSIPIIYQAGDPVGDDSLIADTVATSSTVDNISNFVYNRNCSLFVEYGGKEQNQQITFHYPNAVVLYSFC